MANKKILLAEDEILLLEIMKERLEANNYDVILAENGKEGSFKAMTERPDLILVDLLMPEVDGFEMIKIIRSNSDFQKIPIIAVSALGRQEDIDRAMQVGANDYVVKPFEASELLKKIEDYLK